MTTRILKIVRAALFPAALLAIFLLFTGCNDPFLLTEYLDGAGPTLTMSPAKAIVTTQAATTFTASGGTPSYSYSVVSGPGTVGTSDGVFSSINGPSSVIRAIDEANNWGDAFIEIVETGASGLWISPSSVMLNAGDEVTFTGGGDSDGNYTYSVLHATAGSFADPNLGTYTAPGSLGGLDFGIIQIENGVSETALAIVKIVNPTEAFSVLPLSPIVRSGETIDFTSTDPMVTWTSDIPTSPSNIPSTTSMPDGPTATYTAPVATTGFTRIWVENSSGIIVKRHILIVEP